MVSFHFTPVFVMCFLDVVEDVSNWLASNCDVCDGELSPPSRYLDQCFLFSIVDSL